MSDSEKRRLSHIIRTVQLIEDLLAGKQHDRASAAARLGLQPAAADRQLRAISRLKGIIVEKRGRSRTYRFDRNALLKRPTLPAAIAACFGASLAPLFEGSAYKNAMNEARDHLLQQSRRSSSFRHIERKFVFLVQGGEMSLPDSQGQLDDLIQALLHHRWVTFTYEDFTSTVQDKRVQPLSLVVYKHQLYLIGRDTDKAIRPFRFARIRSIDISEASFEYPSKAEYDPEQVFAHSFGIFMTGNYPIAQIDLKLEGRWATHVRTHRWHRSQSADFSDDAVRLNLNVLICPEVEEWILGFGEEAEVIKPVWLRERIAKRAAALAKRYAREVG